MTINNAFNGYNKYESEYKKLSNKFDIYSKNNQNELAYINSVSVIIDNINNDLIYIKRNLVSKDPTLFNSFLTRTLSSLGNSARHRYAIR